MSIKSKVFILFAFFWIVGGLMVQMNLFDIIYPSVSDPEYWRKSEEAMRTLSTIRMAWIVVTTLIMGCFIWREL